MAVAEQRHDEAAHEPLLADDEFVGGAVQGLESGAFGVLTGGGLGIH